MSRVCCVKACDYTKPCSPEDGTLLFYQPPACDAESDPDAKLLLELDVPSSSSQSEEFTLCWRPAQPRPHEPCLKEVPCMADELELQVEDLQSQWHDGGAAYSCRCASSQQAPQQQELQPSWVVCNVAVWMPPPATVPSHCTDNGSWQCVMERSASPALLLVPKPPLQIRAESRVTGWVSPLERLSLPRPGVQLSRSGSQANADAQIEQALDDTDDQSGMPAIERLHDSVALEPAACGGSGPVGGVPQHRQHRSSSQWSLPPKPASLMSQHHSRQCSAPSQDGHDSNSLDSDQSARLGGRLRHESDSSSDELESEGAVPAALMGPHMRTLRAHNSLVGSKRQADALSGNPPRDTTDGAPASALLPPGKRRATSARATAAALAKQRKRSSGGRGTGPLAPTAPGQCCSICHTQATPVWRAGPLGPKTLCNACGVRYMKTVKPKR